MIVYVYNKKTDVKIATMKKVDKIESHDGRFNIHTDSEILDIPKENIKIVVYGF